MKPLFPIAFMALVMLSACKKETAGERQPVADRTFTIILNPEYIPLSKVDSAYITWQEGTNTDSVKLTPRANDLVTAMDTFPAAEKKYQVHLFTSLTLGANAAIVWQKAFTAALGQKNAINMAAPLNLEDAGWKPRIILKDQAGLRAFCGIRPDDPYFRIHRIDKSWKRFIIDRSYWNTVGFDSKVAGGVWEGLNLLDATGSYENSSFFEFFPVQIGHRFWDHIEIILLFTNATNTETRLLEFFHTLPK